MGGGHGIQFYNANMTVPHSRLGRQIVEVSAAFQSIGAEFALIGGLALASHKVIRATQDVDLLVDADQAAAVETALIGLGYRCLHRSPDAGNYERGDERLDVLYAHRPIARRLLSTALPLKTALGELRVVRAEGLIGLKLQALTNDPRRTQDLDEAPIAAEGGVAGAPKLPEDPYQALDELMSVVEVLCPVWPAREVFKEGSRMLL